MAEIRLRNYQHADAEDLNRIAVSAFNRFLGHYHDGPAMRVIGFVKAHDAPPIFGVAYAVYIKFL
jgi:hypothetical protein